MKFMMLIIPKAYRGNKKLDPNFASDPKMVELMEQMGRFNEDLAKAGLLRSMAGLESLQDGARVAFTKGKPTMTDGPRITANDVVGGYWLLEAKSKGEVVKWTERCPAQDGDILEIRQIFDESDAAAVKAKCLRVPRKLSCLHHHRHRRLHRGLPAKARLIIEVG